MPGVSLRPSDMVQGGLLDDAVVEFTGCGFVMFDYQGKADPAPAFGTELVDIDGGDPTKQYWTVGKAKDWMPSDDGKTLVAVGSATALNNNSNFALLMASIVNAGFPEDKIGDDISVFNGMVAHVHRVAAPKRSGLSGGSVGPDGQKREQTVLVVDTIEKLPWERKKGKGAPKTKKKGKAKSKAPVDDAAVEFVMGVLADKGGEVAKKELPRLAITGLDADIRNAVVKLVYDDGWLGDDDRPWGYADGVVSLT